jgi:hypothetical protein
MSRQRIATASSTIFLAGIMAWSLQPVKSQSVNPSTARMTVGSSKTRVVAYSRITPPSGGVKLLQDIFKKVHNAPQIARDKPGAKKLQESQQLANQAGLSDQNLMIRPKGQGKNLLTSAPQLNWISEKKESSMPQYNNMPQALSGATNGTIGPYGVPVAEQDKSRSNNTGALPPVSMGKLVSQPGDLYRQSVIANNNRLRQSNAPPSPPASPTVITDSRDARLRMVQSGYGSNSSLDLDITSSTHAGKYKTQAQTSRTRGASLAPKPMSQPTTAPLKVAIGKLQNLYKDTNQTLAESERLSEGQSREYSNKANLLKAKVQPGSNYAQLGSNFGQSSYRRAKSSEERYFPSSEAGAGGYTQTGIYIAPSASQPAQSGAGMKKYVQQNTGRWDASQSPGIWESSGASQAGGAVMGEPAGDDAFQSSFDSLGAQNQSGDRELIALLPPNVVTGIPLIRLGSSEAQASSALAQIGKMKVEQVDNWNVWTWSKPGEKDPALQLYVRHGLLDAMRIFDRSLIGSDFGVTLGDVLSKVKETFGEPAFMVKEPQPGAGQNYIYPISQVGFQLARPAGAPANQPPRVVSVLIFHVK